MARWRSRRTALAVGGGGISAAALLLSVAYCRDGRALFPHEQILHAIRFVESSGRDRPPDGDGGRAIGPFQIHRGYWEDAVAAAPELGEDHDYDSCRDRAYAERVVRAYMRRWVPDAWADGDAEVIARTHNGGPAGATRASTHAYWAKVRRQLDALGP